MALWKKISGIMKEIPVNKFTGIDRQNAPGLMIDEGASTYCKNLCASLYPALTVRGGFTKLGTSPQANPIVGLGVYQGSQLHAINKSGSWYWWTGSAWANIGGAWDYSAPYCFCNFRGSPSNPNLMLVSNGVTQYWVTSTGGAVSAIPYLPPGNPCLDTQDDRVFAAGGNNGSTYGNVVSWCNYGAPQYWTPGVPSSAPGDAGSQNLETGRGNIVTCLKAGPSHLTIFTAYDLVEMWGQADNPSTFQLQTVSNQVGCVAQNACTIGPDGNEYFISYSGIYKYSGGVAPDKSFSLPVQYYIDNMNQASAYSIAQNDGSNLYFAIPQGSTTYATNILVYSIRYGVWYSYELGISITAMCVMGNTLYFGDATGNVYSLTGTTDNGTATSWTWTSKPFSSGTLSQKLEMYNLYIVATLPSGSTLNVNVSPTADGSDFALAGTLTGTTLMQEQRIIIPIVTVSGSNWTRIQLTGTGPCTIHEITRQVRELPFR
jgi:hypothetical protein